MIDREAPEPKASRRDTNKADKMQRIVAAARLAFSDRGFEGARMDEIARTAGVAKGTLFLYVDDKRDLLFHVFRADLEPVVVASLGRPLEGAIAAWIEAHYADIINYNRAHERLGAVFLKELGWLGDSRRSVTEAFLRTWSRGLADTLRRAVARGELRPEIEVETLVMLLMDLLLSAMRRWLSKQISQDQLVEYLHRAIALLVDGLSTEKLSGRSKPVAPR